MAKIFMNAADYFQEHEHLIKLLYSSQQPRFIKEAKKQQLEVKKMKSNLRK